jgi:hypothetical protein
MTEIYHTGFGRSRFINRKQIGLGHVPKNFHHLTGERLRPMHYGNGFFASFGNALKSALFSKTTADVLKFGIKNIATPLAQTAIQSAILGNSAPRETSTISDPPTTAELLQRVAPPQPSPLIPAPPEALKSNFQNMKRATAPRIRHRGIKRRNVNSAQRMMMEGYTPAPRSSRPYRRASFENF